jgi:hypothetical protein
MAVLMAAWSAASTVETTATWKAVSTVARSAARLAETMVAGWAAWTAGLSGQPTAATTVAG